MVFPTIPNVKFTEVLHATPPIEKVRLTRERGIKHIILDGKEEVRNAIFVGKIKEYTRGGELVNANVWIDISRPKVILTFGRRGTGKSYDLGIITEGLSCRNSKIKLGDYAPPIIIFDPLNQFWTLTEIPSSKEKEEKLQLELIKKWGLNPSLIFNVRLFVPRGTTLIHPYCEEFAINVSEMTIDEWCGLFKVDKYVDLIGQLLNSAFRKVTRTGYNSLDGRFVAPKKDYSVQDLMECIENDTEISDRERGFAKQTRRAVLVRLNELNESPLFRGKGEIDIRQIFKEGQVVVFMLKDVDESTRSLIVSLVVKKILEGRSKTWEFQEVAKKLFLKADRMKERKKSEELRKKAEIITKRLEETYLPPGWIIIDEAHVLCPSEEYTAAKDILIRYVKQGRAMGLSLAAATQQPSALNEKLISQRDLLLIHQLGIKKDIDAAISQMNPNFPNEIIRGRKRIKSGVPYLIINSLEKGECILSSDELNRNIVVKMRPRVSCHGGKEPLLE